jgi:hypothetical protein
LNILDESCDENLRKEAENRNLENGVEIQDQETVIPEQR